MGQAFIQAVLLMSVFEQRLKVAKLYNETKVVKCTWGSRGAVNSATSSWRPGEGSEGLKP